ncbi:MAG: hypothetical protein IJQ13_08315 [Prevotella sp.]|nr:hypothetical protein [Prevotella sp.]
MKKFLTMTMAAMAFVVSMSSCSKDDDEKVVPVAEQVTGSYTGIEVISVMGEESSNGTSTYEFAKSSDTSVDMTIPSSGEMGHMMIPALPVKGITLSKISESITGKVASYAGTVINAAGEEKAYTVSDLVVLFEDVPKGKAVALSFSLKYGNMPMSMETVFTGDKQ